MLSIALVAFLLIGTANARPTPDETTPNPHRPLPPGFEEVLPEEAKDQLARLHYDRELTVEERRTGIEAVLDDLPKAVLLKLPLPPGLARLPADYHPVFRALIADRSMNWRIRQNRIEALVRALPMELRALVAPPPPPSAMQQRPINVPAFPQRPPPGFDQVLAPTIYAQLLAIHQNPLLSDTERKYRLDEVMRNVPRDQLDRLPLPPGVDRLPLESIERVRQLITDYSLDWDLRHARLQAFVHALPREQRRLLRPPPPAGLPVELRDQIEDIADDTSLSMRERHSKIARLIQSLPMEMRAALAHVQTPLAAPVTSSTPAALNSINARF